MPIPSGEPERGTSPDFSPIRCEFTFSDGRHCRNPAKVYLQDELSPVGDRKVAGPRPQYCAHHASRKDAKCGGASALNAPELEALCADLTTATNINRALAQTFLLMAQGRISRKDAVAFGYLSQLLLQTVPGIRSEFVSSFGYRQWEKRLKHSLDPSSDIDSDTSSGGSGQFGADPDDDYDNDDETDENDDPIKTVIPSEHRERGIPPKIAPVNEHDASERPLSDGLTEPDYGNLYLRSLDLVRRMQAADERESEARQSPPVPAAVKLPKARKVPSAHVQPLASTDPAEPPHAISSDPQVRPPAHQPPNDRPPQPFSLDFFQGPNPSAPEPLPDSLNAPPKRDGHTTDWYAPPSWSGNRPPDPFPNRQEKLKRKFGGMSNSKLRRLQHQNSRSF
jgi:hypothetical protein